MATNGENFICTILAQGKPRIMSLPGFKYLQGLGFDREVRVRDRKSRRAVITGVNRHTRRLIRKISGLIDREKGDRIVGYERALLPIASKKAPKIGAFLGANLMVESPDSCPQIRYINS